MQSDKYKQMIGKNIRFLREERGLSVDDLSTLGINISRSLLSKIENAGHKKDVDLTYINEIARALKVPVHVILQNDISLIEEMELLKLRLLYLEIDDKTEQQLANLLIKVSFRGPTEQANALLLMGEYDLRYNRFEVAKRYFTYALEFATYLADDKLICKARYDLAISFLMLGDYKNALQLVLDDLSIVSAPEDKAKRNYLVGYIYGKQNQYQDAATYMLEAIAQFEESDQPDRMFISRCHQVLGHIYKCSGQFEDSIKFSLEAIEQARKGGVNDVLSEIYSLKTIGETYHEMDNCDEALNWYSKALEKTQGIHFVEMEVLKIRFCIEHARSNYKAMMSILEKLEKLDVAPRDMADFYKKTARVARGKADHDVATEFFEKAIQKLENNYIIG